MQVIDKQRFYILTRAFRVRGTGAIIDLLRDRGKTPQEVIEYVQKHCRKELLRAGADPIEGLRRRDRLMTFDAFQARIKKVILQEVARIERERRTTPQTDNAIAALKKQLKGS